MANKAKFAFGKSSGIQAALEQGIIDSYDVLLLDGDTNPKFGWVDKNGVARIIAEDDEVVFVEGESLPESGVSGKIYVHKDSAFIWNGTEFKDICKPTDVSELEAKIESLANMQDDVDYIVSSKPESTIVDYRDKEIRIMCPADTAWSLQQSGEGSDPNMYYIGVKAYAPNNDVVAFKESLDKTITDETLFTFDDEFAGVDTDGRKYSIIWLPAATYDPSTQTWTYYGKNSVDGKFIGWHYSVEWYDAANEVVASDCIRINLSNEESHSLIEPFYMNEAMQEVKTYTDEQIREKIAEATSGFEVIEF